MDIFEFAMQAEKDGEKLYRELAEKSAEPGLKMILNGLADDEAKHYKILARVKSRAKIAMPDTEILDKAKNVFAQLKEQKKFKFETAEIPLYKQARDLEKKSEDFYREKAGELEDEDQKTLFLRIAKEELKHYWLIEGMIEFLTRPETWLEDAEFTHLEKY